jgi:hypothetical protein
MWIKTVARPFRDRFMAVALLTLCAAIPIGCENREMTLMIEKPTVVHSIDQTPSSSDSQSASVQPGKVITILKAGETARAIGVYHGQDHDGFKVKLADGTEGIIIAGDTFKVVSR